MDQQLKNLVYKNNNFELEDIYYQTTNISKNCNHDIFFKNLAMKM
jgi:hypothetical protein